MVIQLPDGHRADPIPCWLCCSLLSHRHMQGCDLWHGNKQLYIRYLSVITHEPLTRYVTLQVAHAPGIPGTFSPPPGVSDSGMHHSTCVTHAPWCMLGSLTSGFLWSRWRGKRSRHSRYMHNAQFYVSGKRSIGSKIGSVWHIWMKCKCWTFEDYDWRWNNCIITKNAINVVGYGLYMDMCPWIIWR